MSGSYSNISWIRKQASTSRKNRNVQSISDLSPKKRDTTPNKPLEPIIGADIFSGGNDQLVFQNSDVLQQLRANGGPPLLTHELMTY